jgi:hypothetical protein
MSDSYTTYICGLQSGEVLMPMLADEAPFDGRWATRMNGIDSAQHSFQLGSSELSREQWRDLIYPWKRTIEVEWNNGLVYSGLIMGTNWNEDTQTLTVASAEVRSILARRMLFGVGTYDGGTRILTNRSLRGLIYQILFYATQGNLSLGWDLPFSFPAFDEVGAQNREYWNYLFQNAEQLISEAQDSEGGPDVHFQPRWNGAGRREWLIRLGNPKLTGPSKDYHAKSAEPDASTVLEDMDGTEMVTGVFMLGDGSGPDMPHGEAAVLALPGGGPSLDVTNTDFKDLGDVNELAAHARAERDAMQNPTRQTSFSVLAKSFLPDGLPGSPVTLWTPGSKWLDDRQDLRCIGVHGDMTERITIDTQAA